MDNYIQIKSDINTGTNKLHMNQQLNVHYTQNSVHTTLASLLNKSSKND